MKNYSNRNCKKKCYGQVSLWDFITLMPIILVPTGAYLCISNAGVADIVSLSIILASLFIGIIAVKLIRVFGNSAVLLIDSISLKKKADKSSAIDCVYMFIYFIALVWLIVSEILGFLMAKLVLSLYSQ